MGLKKWFDAKFCMHTGHMLLMPSFSQRTVSPSLKSWKVIKYHMIRDDVWWQSVTRTFQKQEKKFKIFINHLSILPILICGLESQELIQKLLQDWAYYWPNHSTKFVTSTFVINGLAPTMVCHQTNAFPSSQDSFTQNENVGYYTLLVLVFFHSSKAIFLLSFSRLNLSTWMQFKSTSSTSALVTRSMIKTFNILNRIEKTYVKLKNREEPSLPHII